MTELPDFTALPKPDAQGGTGTRPASPASNAGGTGTSTGTAASCAANAGCGSGGTLKLDMSVGAAVSALVHHLVQPLAAHYSHAELMALRARLSHALTTAYTPTWNESNPHDGSGSRSLIADRVLGFPPVLRAAAGEIDVDTWARAIVATRRRKAENEDEEGEWEVWCDPGMVVWRWGGWGWDEVEFDPIKRPRESFHVVWQAAPTAPAPETDSPPTVSTPLRQSKAIPIRAPSLANNTPAGNSSTHSSPRVISRSGSPALLLPAVDLTTPTKPPRPTPREYGGIGLGQVCRPNGHKGTDSTSSHSSDSGDTTGSHQLPTPASCPGSAELFPEDKRERTVSGVSVASAISAASSRLDDDGERRSRADRELTPDIETPSRRSTPVTTPTVIPYDGGNVTVLGGGTKLGGSRPASAASRGDRTRSPSVSIASRALSNAVGPNSNGGTVVPGSPRKHRPRRRIMPTYLGHFGQPGIGAPMMGAFGMQSIKNGQPGYTWPHNGGGVGVGLAPPPVSGHGLATQMGMPVTGKRMAS